MRIMQKEKVIYPDLSFQITGIIFKVRKALGRFKNEKQYCDAIEHELKSSEVDYEREKILSPSFNGEKSGRNRADFIIEGKILLEIKAKPFVTKEDYYQARRYLDALGMKLALLVNMRQYYVHPKRILNSGVKE